MIRSNKDLKQQYDDLNEQYLGAWKSLAKQELSQYELDFIEKGMAALSERKGTLKVLELGIGPGRISQMLLRHNIDFYGADISEGMINSFKKKFKTNKKIKKLELCDITKNIPFKDIKFDVIVAFRMLYDNEEWREIIKTLAGRLTKSGVLIFNTHNVYSIASLGSFFGKSKFGYYYTTLKELKNVLAKNNLGFSIVGYGKLPDVIYDKCDNVFLARLLKNTENLLTVFLGEMLFTKMFHVVAKKRS